MIVTLPNTTTREISGQLEKLHVERGEAAQERVMTLIICCSEPDLEDALRTANETSQEHPCRVIAVVPQTGDPAKATAEDAAPARPDAANSGKNAAGAGPEDAWKPTLLSAEIRFGADAGASEIIVLRPKGALTRHLDSLLIPLMVPDTPAVAWWPRTPPANPAHDQIGRMATERITDVAKTPDPLGTFNQLRQVATSADVDLSWTHLTLWRAKLAAMLDQPPHEKITSATVTGGNGNLTVLLMAAWLEQMLHVQVEIDWDRTINGIFSVTFHRADGNLTLTRCREKKPASSSSSAGSSKAASPVKQNMEQSDQAWMITPNGNKQLVSLPHRSMTDILSEELGRLYPDEVYAEVLRSNFSFRQRDVTGQDAGSSTKPAPASKKDSGKKA